MNGKFRLSTALDIDDLLMECTSYAIKLANEKYKFDPPLSIYEITSWGKQGTRSDAIFEFFKDPDFYRTQPVYKGAKEFVKKLSTMTEVFVSTAIPPEFMGIRAKRIMEEFPEIPPDHIYMGSRKDKINVDILFDDAMHNVLRSEAQYPILMRRPWNEAATGMLAVNTYDEFLKLVEVIADSYSLRPEKYSLSEPSVVVLVGPSGSGKSKIATRVLENTDRFEKLVCYTTKDPTAVSENEWYNYVSLETFRQMCESGEMFQSTMYAGHGYGSCKSDVEAILKKGKHVLTTMDICGAMSLKTNFRNVITIYIERDKKALLSNILRKNSSIDDKVNRIIAIDAEKKNAEICDYVVAFDTYENAVEQICRILGVKK
ncbi:MAG: guanylate kinase [Clostridia bacterium]|nr:guanylate kinase [Clostridia bacterium]